MTSFLSLLVAILAFSLIIVAHEVGHLIAAKKSGIFVIEFAIGMGPKLLSRKFGETEYSLRLFPIGGFCKMLGDEQECDDPRAFGSKEPLARFFVIIGGSMMNFLLGIVLIFVLIIINGYTTTTVERVSPDQPAYKAGIQPGDKILSVDGRKIGVFEDILFAMNFCEGKDVVVVTQREGETLSYEITPQKVTGTKGGKTGNQYIIGISPKYYAGYLGSNLQKLERAPIGGCISSAFGQFGFFVKTTYEAVYMLVSGQLSLSELSGIVGIGNVFVESIEEPINATKSDGTEIPLGLRMEAALLNVLNITVLISVNLGIMNMLPLPALDGGRAIFILIEAVRKKPFDQNKEGMIHLAGFILLMAFMVFVTYNDILKVFVNG